MIVFPPELSQLVVREYFPQPSAAAGAWLALQVLAAQRAGRPFGRADVDGYSTLRVRQLITCAGGGAAAALAKRECPPDIIHQVAASGERPSFSWVAERLAEGQELCYWGTMASLCAMRGRGDMAEYCLEFCGACAPEFRWCAAAAAGGNWRTAEALLARGPLAVGLVSDAGRDYNSEHFARVIISAAGFGRFDLVEKIMAARVLKFDSYFAFVAELRMHALIMGARQHRDRERLAHAANISQLVRRAVPIFWALDFARLDAQLAKAGKWLAAQGPGLRNRIRRWWYK